MRLSKKEIPFIQYKQKECENQKIIEKYLENT